MKLKITLQLFLCLFSGILFANVNNSLEFIDIVTCPDPNNDIIAPTIEPVADQTAVAGNTCQATLADFVSLAVVSDNCDPNPTVTQSPVAGTVISNDTSVTLTVTDASGNSAATSFDVLLEDITPPTISSVENHTVATNLNCEAVLTDYRSFVTVTDNCDPNPTVIQSPLAGTIITQNTTVTLIAIDNSNNSASTSFLVSLNDIIKPSINPIADQTASLDEDCLVILNDYTGLAVVDDNCAGTLTVTQNPAPGTIIAQTTLLTMTVTDENGNFESTTFNVIVSDNTPPTIENIATQTIDADINCEAILLDYTNLAVVNDNCDPNPAVSQVPAPGTSFSGSTTIILTVTDVSGNFSTTAFDVNIVDTMDPVIDIISDQVVSADANCQAILGDFTSLAIVTDNCDPNPVITQTPAVGTLVEGSILITMTVTDYSGNSSFTTFDLTVQDNTAPAIDPIADQNVDADANCEAILQDYTSLAVVEDNCDTNPVVSQTPAAGSVISGTTAVQITVTDADGNFSTTTFNVIIEDAIDPTIELVANQIVSADANCGSILLDYSSLAVVADNCDTNPNVTQSPLPGTTLTGITTITLTVTDNSGNFSSTQFDVIIEDITEPSIQSIADQYVDADANCQGTVIDFTSLAVVADNCDPNPAVSQSPAVGTLFTGNTTVTLTVTDDSGNFSTTQFDVFTQDTMVPTIASIADLTVPSNSQCEGILGDYISLAVASDNCDANLTITQTPTAGTVFTGSITVTLTAEDASGNDASTSFEVTIEDTLAPSIDAIADQIVNSDATCQGEVVDYTALAIVTDNCDSAPVVTQTPAPGTIFSGSVTITLTVTDAAGNFDSTSFDVTTIDVLAPIINTIADQTVPATSNCDGILANFSSLAVVNDNCDATPTITQSPAPGTSISSTTLVTLTATDAAGNSSSTSFSVTPEDVTAPAINSIADQTVNSNATCEGMVVDYIALAIVTDNCDSSPVVTQTPVPGTVFIGSITISLTATDVSGNFNSTTFDVTTTDVLAPVINTIADQTVPATNNCDGILTDFTFLAVVTDNCDTAPTITQSPAPGTTISTTTLVTLTATDATGNSSSTSFSVTPEDVTAPAINSIADQTVNSNATCEGVVVDYTTLAIVTDNCDAAPLVTQNPAPGTIFSGSVTITLTATDTSGNFGSTTFDVSTTDDLAPVINTITDQTVNAQASCEGILLDFTNLAVVSDNCDASPVITQTPAAGTVFNGSSMVTLTATDASGNSANISFNVTIVDNTAPSIATIPAQSVNSDANCTAVIGNYLSLAVVNDNCDMAPVLTQSPVAGSIFSGSTTVTLTATDSSGNAATTTFTVNATDNIAPFINPINPQTVNSNSTCEGVLGDYSALAIVNDNCDSSPVVTQSPISGIVFSGSQTVVLTATDATGNFSSVSFVVSVIDAIPPTVDNMPDQVINSNENCGAILPDYTLLAVISDNCAQNPTVVQTPAAGTLISSTTLVTITASDSAGNSSSVDFEVELEDVTPPTILCPGTITVMADENNGQYVLTDLSLELMAEDNCTSSPLITQYPAAGTIFEAGSTHDIQFIVEDAAGNSSQCSFLLKVESTLGIQTTVLSEKDIILFPNPAQNHFSVRYNGKAPLNKMEIFDIRGRSIKTIPVNIQGDVSVDVSDFASGVYWIHISSGTNSITKKLVKE